MKIRFAIAILLLPISNEVFAQEWQTVFSVDSRLGYSSNTYLNPYYSEWDRSQNVSFGVVSGIAQTTWLDGNNIVELTGVGVFEPLFSAAHTWKGGLGLVNYQRKFNQSLSGGVELGGSYFNGTFSRRMIWGQPKIVWSPSPFSQLTVKVGSNFRSYRNYMIDSVATDIDERSDLYALEFETWPNFNWKFSTGLYGNLDSFPAIQKGFSSYLAVSRILQSGARIRVKAGLERYQNEETIATDGGGGGFPPVGGGPSRTTETLQQTNRIFRLGVEGNVPISSRFMVFASAEGIQYSTSTTSKNINDVQISGGFRMNLQPTSKDSRGKVSPNWNKKENVQTVEVKYSGKGRIYLVGEFNNWQRPGIPLINTTKKTYKAELELDAGAYEYKVLEINGSEEDWVEFSEGTYTIADGFGGKNALLLVE